MKTIEVYGQVDTNHKLSADVPADVPPGRVKLAIVVQGEASEIASEDEAGLGWATGVAQEWADELADSTQDIYSFADGEPVDESR